MTLAVNHASTHASPPCEFGGVHQAAAILDVSASYLNKLRMTGGGPPYSKFGKSVRYHLPSLPAWGKSQTRRSTSETK